MFDQMLISKFVFRPQDHAKMDSGLTKKVAVTDKRLKILDADGRFLKHFLGHLNGDALDLSGLTDNAR